MSRSPLVLPEFPWDALAPYAGIARAHPEGIVDLSIGSPVDGTPEIVRAAVQDAADAHGYPSTAGTREVRQSIVDWFARRRGVHDLTVENVLPTIGSKELIALLPLLLGLGRGDVVVCPRIAYPTYAIGAALVGATVVAADDPAEWPDGTRLVWVNSPGNPDGRMLGADALRAAVLRARELDAVIVGDECYAEFSWGSTGTAVSILDPRVIDGDRSSVLAVYSLSKQSNLAGYRAGLVAGCGDLIGELLAARRHAGLIPPTVVQSAMVAALGDDDHVAAQRERYRGRRERLGAALASSGFRIDDSEGGLYLWATRGDDSWETVDALAALGILVVPGSFYGEHPAEHVRIALTATDADIDRAVDRLGSLRASYAKPAATSNWVAGDLGSATVAHPST